MVKAGPDFEISLEAPFDQWSYERQQLVRTLPLVVLFLVLLITKVVLFGTMHPIVLYLALAVLVTIPFVVVARSQMAEPGEVILEWEPDPGVTARLRRVFNFQVTVPFVTLTILAALVGKLFLSIVFLVYIPVIIYLAWWAESRLCMTHGGIANRVGILSWNAISGLTIFPEEGVMVMKISTGLGYLVPNATYSIPDVGSVCRSIEGSLFGARGPTVEE